MSTAARIEELRNKFEENPRRYFAPLANELRKAGDLTQAIALCREHLPKQPGHMSGYIVFGQALYENGELDKGRVVFEQALALDPENLIALHHLGHIARQQGDAPLARRWYERALETDPRNEDIAHQLAALATPVRPVTTVPTPPVAAPAEVAPPGQASAADEALAFLDHGAIPGWNDLRGIPTPDVGMRSIDIDRVNDALRTPGLHAFVEGDMRAPALEPVATPELVDLSLDDPAEQSEAEDLVPEPFAVVTDEPLDASALVVSDDPFFFADDTPVVAAMAARDEAAELVDLSADFEEGLVTAEWPDISEFTGRVPTPRSVTPAFVEVTPDAVAAFGREPQDPIVAALPAPELEVLGDDADLVVPPVLSMDTVDGGGSVPEPRDEPRDELPWMAAAVAPSEEMSAIAAAFEEDARAVGEVEGVSVSLWSEPPGLIDLSEEAYADAASAGTPSEEARFVDVLSTDADETSPTGEEPAAPAFVTETMGELLVAQGFVDRAVTVYEELVRRRPYDPVLSARLEELRQQLEQAPPVRVYTAGERYAALAAHRVPRRTPPRAATPVVTPAAVPVVTPVATPVVTPVAMQAPTPAIPTPIRAGTPIQSASPLRADTPIGLPAQETLGALFGSESASHDDTAAKALADAFAPAPLDVDPPAHPDSFFGATDSGRVPTPAYGTSRPSAPVTPVAPGAEQGGEFSFDRFFPDPATNVQQLPASDEPSAIESAPRASDDLAQFSVWLKGLGKT